MTSITPLTRLFNSKSTAGVAPESVHLSVSGCGYTALATASKSLAPHEIYENPNKVLCNLNVVQLIGSRKEPVKVYIYAYTENTMHRYLGRMERRTRSWIPLIFFMEDILHQFMSSSWFYTSNLCIQDAGFLPSTFMGANVAPTRLPWTSWCCSIPARSFRTFLRHGSRCCFHDRNR